MMKSALLALALISLPAPFALAEEATPTVQTPAPAPESGALREGDMSTDGTKIVCRKYKVTGTRFKRKDCKSEAAWKDWDAYTKANAKESTDKLQRNGCSGANPGSCF
jgi:hypothetical protein